jgi:hypothetical protein
VLGRLSIGDQGFAADVRPLDGQEGVYLNGLPVRTSHPTLRFFTSTSLGRYALLRHQHIRGCRLAGFPMRTTIAPLIDEALSWRYGEKRRRPHSGPDVSQRVPWRGRCGFARPRGAVGAVREATKDDDHATCHRCYPDRCGGAGVLTRPSDRLSARRFCQPGSVAGQFGACLGRPELSYLGNRHRAEVAGAGGP